MQIELNHPYQFGSRTGTRLRTNLPKHLKRISLRPLAIVPFTLQLIGTVGLVGYLSFKSGQAEIDGMSNRLLEAVSDRVTQRLQAYVDAPQHMNQVNAEAVRSGELDLKNLDVLHRRFLSQIQRSDLSSIQFGNQQGNFRVVRVLDGEFQILEVDGQNPNQLSVYRANDNGQKDGPPNITNYLGKDNLDRPWAAAELGLNQPTPSPVSLLKTREEISLYSAYPIYDRANQPLGVFAATIKFSGINQFLSQLKISRSGQVFVIDRSGNLIGNSAQEERFESRNKPGDPTGLTQLSLENSGNLVAREVGEALRKNFGNLSQINQSQKLDFACDRKHCFAEVVPFSDRQSLGWLIVTVLPDSDFAADRQKNTRTTIELCLVALAGSIVLGTFTAFWTTRLLRRLRQTAQAIAAGDLNQEFSADPSIYGLEETSVVLNQMIQKFRQSLNQVQTALQESKEKYETVFRTSPDAIGVIDHLTSQWVEVNEGFVKQTEYTFEEVIGRTVDSLNLFTHPERIEELRKQVMATGVAENYEIYWQTKSGKPRVSLISVRMTRLGGKPYRLFISKDITELKQAEAALHEKDEFFRLIVTHTPDVVMIYDRDRRFQYVNPTGLQKNRLELRAFFGETRRRDFSTRGDGLLFANSEKSPRNQNLANWRMYLPASQLRSRDIHRQILSFVESSGRSSSDFWHYLRHYQSQTNRECAA